MAERAERRLVTILAADIAEYSRLMRADEDATLAALAACRAIVDARIAGHRGRIANTAGDAVLAEFPSVSDGLLCALAIQEAIAEQSAAAPPERRMLWRIGLHLGDVMVRMGDLYGDAVNIAARLQALAEPGGICASAALREHAGGRVAASFADAGLQQVKNIAEPIRVYRVSPAAAPAAPAALALPDKPSIAVLPFQNLSGDPEQEYFADGMVEEIITALSRIRWLFVIARNSSFIYKGQTVDVKRVGHELGVRYVLEGSVRKAGGRVRITAQLIEAETGAHLWADHFDGSLEDVFDLQDKVATGVAGVIEPALQASEIRRSTERPTQNLTAYDLYLRAAQAYHTGSSDRAGLQGAAKFLGEAIERDSRYALAHAFAAFIRCALDVRGGTDDPEANRQEAIELAQKALQLAPDDPGVLSWAAFALGYFGNDIYPVIALTDRSLELNPGYARGWLHSGVVRCYAGDLDLAIEHIETAMRLDPRANMGLHLAAIGIALFFGRRFEEAAPKFLAAIQQRSSYLTPYRFLAACYAHMGRMAEARDVIAKLRAVHAGAVEEPRVLHWRKPEHQELILSGLRKAMGKER